MKRSWLLHATASLALLTGCARPSPDLEAERTAVMQVSREWAQAAASGDVERIVSYWADDAVVMPPDQPAVVGKAAIREFVKASLAIPGFTITWEPERAEVSRGGDLAYLIERNRWTVADASGAPRTQHGKAVTVWRKDANGAWKCVLDAWNAGPREGVVPAVNIPADAGRPRSKPGDRPAEAPALQASPP